MSKIKQGLQQYAGLYGDDFTAVACVGVMRDGELRLCLYGDRSQMQELFRLALEDLEDDSLSKIKADA